MRSGFQLVASTNSAPVAIYSVSTLCFHAFVASRVDYCKCNSILYTKLRPLTFVLFSLCLTPQLVWWSKSGKRLHTPTLRYDLHWLLLRRRVDFRICLPIYKCLHQIAPVYLTSLLTPVTAILNPSASAVRWSRWFGHTKDENCALRSSKLLGCWFISVEQSALELNSAILTVG